MKTFRIYSIRDRIVGEYGALSVFCNDEQAKRNFDYVMSNSPMVARDCELYYLGEYNPDSGLITPLPAPEFICFFEVKHE